jgi:4-hydroxybenzoate polyprenyltransferase
MLRRLTVTAVVLGAVGIAVALLLDAPLAALGVGLGVATGFWNVRLLDRQVSKVDVDPDASRKALRRMVGSRSLLRLSVITAVAFALVLIVLPLGIGIVVGLVIFQLAFVGNVLRVMLGQGGVA